MDPRQVATALWALVHFDDRDVGVGVSESVLQRVADKLNEANP